MVIYRGGETIPFFEKRGTREEDRRYLEVVMGLVPIQTTVRERRVYNSKNKVSSKSNLLGYILSKHWRTSPTTREGISDVVIFLKRLLNSVNPITFLRVFSHILRRYKRRRSPQWEGTITRESEVTMWLVGMTW